MMPETPRATPIDEGKSTPNPSTTTTETSVLARAIELARELTSVLEDTRPLSQGAAKHELSLANSLTSHVLDILSSLAPACSPSTAAGDAE